MIGWSAWVAAEEKEAKSCPLMAKKGTKGKCYAFCCPGCKGPFDKNPEKYISKEFKSKEPKKSEGHKKHHR